MHGFTPKDFMTCLTNTCPRTTIALSIVLVVPATVVRPSFGDLVVPTDGMVILADTTFAPGTYVLPNGVSIGASGVTLDLNGAELVGTGGVEYGITSIGHDDVTIRNGIVRGYYYGLRIEDCAGPTIATNDLSDNYVDPLSLAPGAPFLNINVGPMLPNFTNLGGGLYMLDVVGATVTGNTMRSGQNGMDLFFVTGGVIDGNDASDNTGWGIHLHGSTKNTVSNNTCDDCIRPGLGDSAGMLLVKGSSNNAIVGNSFRGGGVVAGAAEEGVAVFGLDGEEMSVAAGGD